MSIAELFESGEKKSNKGQFRNLVMVARADGNVSEEEQQLIAKMGRKIGLNDAQIQEVKDHPEQYPIYPPTNKEDRFERLIGLVEMIGADGEIEEHEVRLMFRYAIGLGFSDDESLKKLIARILREMVDGKTKYDILEGLVE